VGQFTETGAFGAFNVAAAKGDSLQTTLGIRASTRIDLGGTTLVPEFRAGWAHEFLDPS
jgi:outer membrane autotransporter protein